MTRLLALSVLILAALAASCASAASGSASLHRRAARRHVQGRSRQRGAGNIVYALS